MVKYRLKEKTEDELVYWYYPEGREDKHHGVVIVNLLTNDIVISELAEDDFEREISVEEHNRFIDSLNEMIKENGESDFVDHVAKPEKYAFYGCQVIQGIRQELDAGSIPEKGCRVWY